MAGGRGVGRPGDAAPRSECRHDGPDRHDRRGGRQPRHPERDARQIAAKLRGRGPDDDDNRRGHGQVEAADPRPAQAGDPRQSAARGSQGQQKPRQHAAILWAARRAPGPPPGARPATASRRRARVGLPWASAESIAPCPDSSPPALRSRPRRGRRRPGPGYLPCRAAARAAGRARRRDRVSARGRGRRHRLRQLDGGGDLDRLVPAVRLLLRAAALHVLDRRAGGVARPAALPRRGDRHRPVERVAAATPPRGRAAQRRGPRHVRHEPRHRHGRDRPGGGAAAGRPSGPRGGDGPRLDRPGRFHSRGAGRRRHAAERAASVRSLPLDAPFGLGRGPTQLGQGARDGRRPSGRQRRDARAAPPAAPRRRAADDPARSDRDGRRDHRLPVGDPGRGRAVPRPVAFAAARRRRRPAGPVRGAGPPGGRGHRRRSGTPGRRAQVRAARLGLARPSNATLRDSGRGRKPDGPRRPPVAGGGTGDRSLDRPGGSAT